MQQAWLQVAGLILDFAGFALIATEWILAQRYERAARAIEEAEVRRIEIDRNMQRAPGMTSPVMQRHFEMSGAAQQRMAALRLGSTRTHYTGMRSAAVYSGMTMVLLGFIGQLLGAIPGCCGALGIVPV